MAARAQQIAEAARKRRLRMLPFMEGVSQLALVKGSNVVATGVLYPHDYA